MCHSDFNTGSTVPSLSYLYGCHFVGYGETCIASSAAGRCWKSSFEVDSLWVLLKRLYCKHGQRPAVQSCAEMSCAELGCAESRAALSVNIKPDHAVAIYNDLLCVLNIAVIFFDC